MKQGVTSKTPSWRAAVGVRQHLRIAMSGVSQGKELPCWDIHNSPFTVCTCPKVSCSPKVTSRDLKSAAVADLGIIRYSPTTDDGQKSDAMSV